MDGTTSHITGLAQGLDRLGHTVALAAEDFLANAPADAASLVRAQLSSAGVVQYDVSFPRSLHTVNAAKALRATLTLRRIVREFKPDILHVHWRSTSPYAALVRGLTGIPFVSTLHLERIPAGPIMRRLSFWGDRAIAISTETEDTLATTFGVDRERITKVWHGVDEGRFRPPSDSERRSARDSFRIHPDTFVVSVVARVTRDKGQHLLLQALARIRERLPRVVALIAGKGEALTDLRALASELDVAEKVRFVGHVDPVAALWASDLSALPSSIEGFPYSVIESMMCAVPVIRTPAGGYREQIVHGENGIIIPFGSDEELASAISALAVDRARLEAMSEAAHASARSRFSLSAMATRTESIYEDVLAQARRL